MFDVGFWELIMIAVVALVVVGPERLPRMARVAGLWLGRAQRMLGSVKAEIDRELKADELKEIMRKQAASNPLTTIIEETSSLGTRSFRSSAGGTEAGSGSSDTDALTRAAQASGAAAPAPAAVPAQAEPQVVAPSPATQGAPADPSRGAGTHA
jgi:sec-independent protein translocase protein TatB